MCNGSTAGQRQRPSPVAPLTTAARDESKPSWIPVLILSVFLSIDVVVSLVLFTPLIPRLNAIEDESPRYTLWGSLWDLGILTALRSFAVIYALVRCYHQDGMESPFNSHHPNGDKKSREELEEEALEESCLPWFRRYISRYSFPCELISVITASFVVVKCLSRLNVEIGIFDDAKPNNPLFWFALCIAAMAAVVECGFVDSVGERAGKCGQYRRRQNGFIRRNISVASRIGSFLNIPLLSAEANVDSEENDIEALGEETNENSELDVDIRASSDIAGDAEYKAGWTDLIGMCKGDSHLIALAFVFLVAAAAAQIYIPKYTGNILDALSEAYNGKDSDQSSTDVLEIPGFMSNIIKLVIVSILGGIFSGIRGSIFTVVGGRVNVRLRVLLMDSLLSQDIGFFDVTKTGDITSRLSSDTTLVGDQVSLNVNVFLRSLVQSIGVLIFMFMISWKLSLLAFISVPVITILSKWYGNYVRSLTKLMQKKLADGNCVSEAALGSMSTVRAFGAECSELKEFEVAMEKYLSLNLRSAVVYVGYMVCYTSLPSLVTALVLFYGGLLVYCTGPDHISSGQLVSFLLYLTSLSDAFNSIGYIFASLTQAIGAADKVFELMYREPRITPPSGDTRDPIVESDSIVHQALANSIACSTAKRTVAHQERGLRPTSCSGEIILKGVDMHYPARPKRKILDDLSLSVPPGAVVALVGPSGGGKSSIVSLVQHLYEPSKGEVLIDGNKVHDLSKKWLSKNVSIVSQEPTLFARSIRQNIMYGLEGTDSEPSMGEIEEAARMANAASFIESLPMGYETDVGERGVQLSGGQKQRIAIARALVRKPRILLLDEATSALDSESEALVQEAIDGMLARGRSELEADSQSMTVIIIAHRLSTVRNADVIFVIESGNVVERGSHEALIQNKNGAYSNLIKRQIKHDVPRENDPKQDSPKQGNPNERRSIFDQKAN